MPEAVGVTTQGGWRPSLYAALGCFAASLAVAGLLSLRYGLGMGDLPAIAFWSGLLALLVGGLETAVGTRLRGAAGWVIWPTLILGGSLLAFGWTLGVSAILGPWFQASSIPVLFCWLAGVLVGLTVGLTTTRHLTVVQGLIAGVLTMLVSLGLAVRSEDLVAFATGDQMLEVVIVKATDLNEPLQVDAAVQSALGEADVTQLRAAGVTGRLRLVSVGSHGMSSRKARAVIVLANAVEHSTELPQPDRRSIIYFLQGGEWRRYPSDAPTLKRSIRLQPSQGEHSASYVVELADGSLQGGGL